MAYDKKKTPPWTLPLQLFQKYDVYSFSALYDECSAAEWRDLSYIIDFKEHIDIARLLYIKNQLEIQRVNRWDYVMHKIVGIAEDRAQQLEIARICEWNRIDPKRLARDVYDVLTMAHPKINALRFWGVPNSGKTLLANCLCAPFVTCYMNNHGSENEFFLSNMLNKSIILCEELYITIATAEDMKSVLGGQPIDIAKKFQEKQTLKRTPVIITSNYERFGRGHLCPTDESALSLRCKNYYFNHEVLPNCHIAWPQLYMFLYKHLF